MTTPKMVTDFYKCSLSGKLKFGRINLNLHHTNAFGRRWILRRQQQKLKHDTFCGAHSVK